MKHNSVAGGTVGDLFVKAQLSLPMGNSHVWEYKNGLEIADVK